MIRSAPARTVLLLSTAVLALSVSACDIPATGVVEAGEPATGVLDPLSVVPEETAARPVQAVPVPVYFLRDGSLVAVPRMTAVPADPQLAVATLLVGPDDRERRDGLSTELPAAPVAPTVRTDGAAVVIELPDAVGELSGTAIDQLACTAAAARLRQDPELSTAQVTVEQPDGRLAGRSSDSCPDDGAAVLAPLPEVSPTPR